MKQVLFLMMIILVISGCELPQGTATKNTEDKVSVGQETVVSSQALQPGLISQEAVNQNSDQEKMQAVSEEIEVKAIVLAKEDKGAVSDKVSEEIIAENRWGFSIYDPKTGIVEYYASKGGYLGERTVQQ